MLVPPNLLHTHTYNTRHFNHSLRAYKYKRDTNNYQYTGTNTAYRRVEALEVGGWIDRDRDRQKGSLLTVLGIR